MLKYSQKDFAKKIKLSLSYIAAIELGKRPVNDRIIQLICQTFPVNETWLKNGEGEPFIDGASAEFAQALSIFNKLDPDFQNYVLEQMNALLELQEKKAAIHSDVEG